MVIAVLWISCFIMLVIAAVCMRELTHAVRYQAELINDCLLKPFQKKPATAELTGKLDAGTIARSLSAALTVHRETINSVFNTRHKVSALEAGNAASNLVCQDDNGVLTVSLLGVINMLLLDQGSNRILVSVSSDDKIMQFDTCLFEEDDEGNLSIGSTSKHRLVPAEDERLKKTMEPLPTPVDTPEAAVVPVDAAAEAACCDKDCESNACATTDTPPAASESSEAAPA